MITVFIVYTINHVQITFDPSKDRTNQRKHGVSLGNAVAIDWDTAMEERDDREDYGEDRYRAFGAIGDTLYCVVYVDRKDERRIISLRKANAREVRNYVEANR